MRRQVERRLQRENCEILTVDREFPANVFPWIKRAERTGDWSAATTQ